ncbi:hypothetical protein IT575_08860 [bacterium]|nr:hypothetical protein [bacterium]
MRKLIAVAGLAGVLLCGLSGLARAESGWASPAMGSGEVALAAAPDTLNVAAAVSNQPTGEVMDCCLMMPGTCEIQQVALTISCCGCTDPCEPGSKDGIIVSFFDKEWKLLAMAKLGGPWCDCDEKNHFVSKLDKAIDPSLVCHVRVSKPGEDQLSIQGFKIKVSSSDECECPRPKWWTIAHCQNCCNDISADSAYIVSSPCCGE